MDFERSLAFDSGLAHSPKGIFQYQPEPPALLPRRKVWAWRSTARTGIRRQRRRQGRRPDH